MLTDILYFDFVVSIAYLRGHIKPWHMLREQQLARHVSRLRRGRTVFILKMWFAAELLPEWVYGPLRWAAPLRFLPAALGILLL